MTPEKTLLLCRGAGGVGCWTLNRNFVREFGLDATFVLSDFIRAYTYGDKIKTNVDDWFLWTPHTMMSFCRWPEARLQQAVDALVQANVFEAVNMDDELRLKLNLEYLQEIGGSIETGSIIHEKTKR